ASCSTATQPCGPSWTGCSWCSSTVPSADGPVMARNTKNAPTMTGTSSAVPSRAGHEGVDAVLPAAMARAYAATARAAGRSGAASGAGDLALVQVLRLLHEERLEDLRAQLADLLPQSGP